GGALGLRARSAVSSWYRGPAPRASSLRGTLPWPVRRTDMNALIRLAVVVTVVLPLTVLGCFGLRFACSPEDLRSLLREVRRREELQQAQQVTLRRLDAREEEMRDVIAQRASLKEA